MNNKRKAIVLDMDGTLEYGVYENEYLKENLIMVLRPNLDKLIAKLKEVKKKGIDVILCTTANDTWVEKFLNLSPEFRNLFDKKYTRDNEKIWKKYTKKEYPLEYKAKKENINLENLKPVTTFGYDSVLFIDDNKSEVARLRILFELTGGKLMKDITFFSGFGFYGTQISQDKILKYKIIANKNKEFAQKLEEYLETEENNPGCKMMCSVIDTFMNKNFIKGLKFVDEEYKEEYDIFHKKIALLQEEIEKFNIM